MRKQLQKEQGFAALVAIMVVLLLTIIGTNLLSVTTSSFMQVRKTETRGEAEFYAKMGMDEAMARLRKAVQGTNDNATAGERPSDLQDEFAKQLNVAFGMNAGAAEGDANFTRVLMRGGLKWNTTRDPYRVPDSANASYQIYFTQKTVQTGADSNSLGVKEGEGSNPFDVPYIEQFTFRVVGKSHGGHAETRTLEATVYVHTLPEEFHYVLSTSRDLKLNGAALIEGDTFAYGKYVMRGQAQLASPVIFNGSSGVSELPSALPSVVGQAVVEDSPETRFYSDESTQIDMNQFDRFFAIAPRVKKAKPALGEVGEIGDTVQAKVDGMAADFNQDHLPLQAVTPSGAVDKENEYATLDHAEPGKSIHAGLAAPETPEQAKEAQTIMDMGTGILSIDGDLWVDGRFEMKDSRNNGLDLQNGGRIFVNGTNDPFVESAILRGKVKLQKNSYIVIDGNALFENLELTDAIVFVRGDLRIQGTFHATATIYVDGNIMFSQETGSENRTSVVFLTNGNLSAYNLNENGATPMTIRAFVYRQQDAAAGTREPLSLYGICSNVRFVGGFYSYDGLELNALRADDKDGKLMCTQSDDGDISINQDSVPSDPLTARLQIVYDYGLFESPPPGLPSVAKTNMKIVQYELDTFDANYFD